MVITQLLFLGPKTTLLVFLCELGPGPLQTTFSPLPGSSLFSFVNRTQEGDWMTGVGKGTHLDFCLLPVSVGVRTSKATFSQQGQLVSVTVLVSDLSYSHSQNQSHRP